jgi:hypothetical protein
LTRRLRPKGFRKNRKKEELEGALLDRDKLIEGRIEEMEMMKKKPNMIKS